MSFQQRTMVALALCALIYLIFDFVMPKPEPLEGEPGTEVVDAEGKEGKEGKETKEDRDREVEQDAKAPAEGEDEQPQAEPTPDVEVVRHTVRNDLIAVELTNRSPARGGIISGLQLLSEQFAGHETATDALMLGGATTLAVNFADAASDIRIPAGAAYEVRDASSTHITLAYADEDVEVVERFELLEGYEARLRVRVTNRTGREQPHRLHLQTRIGLGESRYDVHRGLCRLADDLEYEDQGDVEDGPIEYGPGVRWGGVDGKYFTSLIVPEHELRQCTIGLDENGDYLDNRLSSDVAALGPGETHEYLFGIYLGAKEIERLGAFSAVALPEGELEDAIDWGILGGLSEALGRVLLAMMRWFYQLVHSWGIAIVLLTIVVKLLTLPLTLKQMSSMKRMKEIQPEIEKIKEKYADDRVKQGQEMQALFARSGANPLAGCLPMIVQMPIWFALYSMLGTAVELVHVPFLWLPDLTQQDPYYALPLGLGAMMILQQRMMPTAGSAEQAKMMRWVMPIMFTVFMLFLPSGLGVYIFVNIVLSVIQTAIQVGTGAKETKAESTS